MVPRRHRAGTVVSAGGFTGSWLVQPASSEMSSMRLRLAILQSGFLAAVLARGQGSFVFDQQSSTNETAWPYGAGVNIQQADPYGQSFVPTFSALNFVTLNLND